MTIPYGTDYTCPHGEPLGACGEPECWRAEEPPADEPSYLDRLRAALVDTYGLDRLPDPDPLIGEGIVFRDSLVWLIGKPGSAKSFVALDIAGCVATGETWQGYRTHQGPVLYLVAEGVTGTKKRVRAWEKAYGHPMAGVHFLPVDVQAKNGGHWDAFVTLASELRPVLIICDTQARITIGYDENSNSEMGEFVARCEALRKATRACVVIVHHVGKADNGGRGATAVEGAVSTIIKATRDGEQITLTCAGKNKDGEEWEPIGLRMVPMGDSVVLGTDDGKTGANVVELCGKWLRKWRETFRDELVSVSTLIDTGIVAKNTFHTHKLALIDAGVLARVGEGRNVRYGLVFHE